MISRRALLAGAAAAAVAGPAAADVDPGWRPRELEVLEIPLRGDVGRRLVLGIPRRLAGEERVPLLVLLHGLGETGDERTGAWAWFERYGLGTSYDRLCASWSSPGLVLACPYMPNLSGASLATLDAYATFIAREVVPRARREAPALDTAQGTYLGGCSLGGTGSLEVLLRRPEVFGAWGGVQTAVNATAAVRYADRLAAMVTRVGPRALLIETSSGDPFREGNDALARSLTRDAVANTYVELPGPHDQRWLRARGTEQMLRWFGGLGR